MALKDCIKKEANMTKNLKYLLDIVDKLMDPSQGYSLGQIADTFNNLKVKVKPIFFLFSDIYLIVEEFNFFINYDDFIPLKFYYLRSEDCKQR